MRTLMAGLAALAAVLGAAGEAAAQTARGVVYEDQNSDGQRGAAEPGVAGVLVSNGVDVVRTDADGAYRIALPARGAVFVVQPPGYAVAHDANFTPRFYYWHEPAADPADAGLGYVAPTPTGQAPEAIDFPLTHSTVGERLSVLAFADPQPTTDEELSFVRDDFILEAAGAGADFALGLGDLMNDDLSLIPRYQDLMGTLGVPVWSVAGNHELNFRATDDAGSLRTFHRFFGPSTYAFMAGRAAFLVLDNVHYRGTGTAEGPFAPNPNPRGIGRYHGEIGADGLAFVRNMLAHIPQDHLVVLAMHIPLVGTWDGENVNTQDRDALLALLCRRTHVVVLAGHMHAADHRYLPCPAGAARESVHQHSLSAVSGSWWSGPIDDRGIPVSLQTDGAPNGYYVMEIDGAAYRTRFKPQRLPADQQMRITLDAMFYRYSRWAMRDYRWGEIAEPRITTDQLAAAQIYVNLFDGGPRSQVSARIGPGGAPFPLERVHENDPAAEEYFFRAEGVRLNLTAAPTTHLWRARLPADLPAGVHVVHVTAVDEFGAEHQGRMILEVLRPR